MWSHFVRWSGAPLLAKVAEESLVKAIVQISQRQQNPRIESLGRGSRSAKPKDKDKSPIQFFVCGRGRL